MPMFEVIISIMMASLGCLICYHSDQFSFLKPFEPILVSPEYIPSHNINLWNPEPLPKNSTNSLISFIDQQVKNKSPYLFLLF